MSDAEVPSRTPERIDQLLFGALAGLSVAFILQLVDKEPEIDRPLGGALYCFSVALPMVVSSFLLEVAGSGKPKSTPRRIFDLVGILLSLTGFVFVFFHVHLIAGVIFLASVFLCLIVVLFSLRR
jgi:hypothetical protein